MLNTIQYTIVERMNLVDLLNEQLKLGLVSESRIIFNIMTALNSLKSNALTNQRKKKFSSTGCCRPQISPNYCFTQPYKKT